MIILLSKEPKKYTHDLNMIKKFIEDNNITIDKNSIN